MLIGGLRWKGKAFFIGIPARDLTKEEAELHGVDWLVSSGLYEPIFVEPVAQQAEEETWESMA